MEINQNRKVKATVKSNIKSEITTPSDHATTQIGSKAAKSAEDRLSKKLKSQIVKVTNTAHVNNLGETEEQKAKRLKVVRKVAVKPQGVAGKRTTKEIQKDRRSLEIYKPPGTGIYIYLFYRFNFPFCHLI